MELDNVKPYTLDPEWMELVEAYATLAELHLVEDAQKSLPILAIDEKHYVSGKTVEWFLVNVKPRAWNNS